MCFRRSLFFAGCLSVSLLVPRLGAWGEFGHNLVNRLALASLPQEFPNFVRTPENTERIVYLANVPDFWRNTAPYLQQSGGSWVDHFINLEQLPNAGLDPRTVPSFRLDFALVFAAGRQAHSQNFPPLDHAKNQDHTQEWPGFAPWAMAEYYHKLRSAFGTLKAFQELGGTPVEIANAQADAVQAMGVMGHYIGDCAQPLHTTNHHDGWVGPNPQGYTTTLGFHRWVDRGLIPKAGIRYADLQPRVRAAEPFALATQPDGRDPYFVVAMNYILTQFAQVEPLYRLEKAGDLGNRGGDVSPAGRAFIEEQLLVGAQMLARTWVTAWRTAPQDAYVSSLLALRQPAKEPAPKQP